MEFFGLTFIMFTGAFIALLGMLILMFAAFSTSAAWGIATLLIPPLSLGFALTHWSKGKNGFAITMIGLIVFSYGAWDRQQKERIQLQESQREEEVRLIEPPLNKQVDGSTRVAPTPPGAVSAPPPSSTPAPARPATGIAPSIVNMIDAHKFIESEVRVTTSNGTVRTGILLEVSNGQIVLEYKPKGLDTVIKANINENDIQLIELIN